MIVLHAIWDNNKPAGLHVWAESSLLVIAAGRTLTRPVGKSKFRRKPKPHPFVLGSVALKEELSVLTGGFIGDGREKSVCTSLNLLLPSAGSAAASPGLRNFPPTGSGRCSP